MLKKYKKPLTLLIIFAVIGQILFLIMSGKYTSSSYEGKIYSTVGIRFEKDDLAKLNEAAHYFGQTMIGWTKFPNFKDNLIEYSGIPENSEINMKAQERQNFVFTISTDKPLEFETLKSVKDFLQAQIDEYNSKTNTKFVLSNVDYENVETTRSYAFGALVTLILSMVAGFAILFVRKEFFPPKLKL